MISDFSQVPQAKDLLEEQQELKEQIARERRAYFGGGESLAAASRVSKQVAPTAKRGKSKSLLDALAAGFSKGTAAH